MSITSNTSNTSIIGNIAILATQLLHNKWRPHCTAALQWVIACSGIPLTESTSRPMYITSLLLLLILTCFAAPVSLSCCWKCSSGCKNNFSLPAVIGTKDLGGLQAANRKTHTTIRNAKIPPTRAGPNNRPILRLINLFSKPVSTKFSAALLFVHPQQGHPEEDGRNVFFSSTAKYHLAWPSWWASWGLLYFFYFFF